MSLTVTEVQQRDLGLPRGWTRTKFGEIYELVYGKSLVKAARNTDGQYLVYGSSGIVGHHDTFLVEGPVIVVGRKGAAGAVTFSTRPCWPIDTTYYVRDCEHFDLRYSYYFLTSLRLGQFDRSTAIPGLNRDDAYDLVVHLPPLAEQRRIVSKIEELFSELDKGIEKLEKAREQIKVYRQAVLKHAFEGKLTAQWREENQDQLENPEQLLGRIKHEREARYDQHRQEWNAAVDEWHEGGKLGKKPARLKKPQSVADVSDGKKAQLPKLPEGWLWARLGNISEIAGGLTKNQKRNDLPTRMKYLRVANVYSDRIVTHDVYEMGVTNAEAQKVALRLGDLLIVEGNGSIDQIGRVAMWDGRLSLCGHQNHLIRARLSAEFSPRFFLHFLLSPLGRELVVREASSTSGLHTLSISKVSALVVPVMSSAEEAEILARLEARLLQIDKSLEKVDAELLRSQMLRQSILKKAFSGQLVAQDPNEEPASVLLERIKAERLAQSHSTKLRNKHRRARATA